MSTPTILSFPIPAPETARIMSHAHFAAADLDMTESACPYPPAEDAEAQARREAWLWCFREYRAIWLRAEADTQRMHPLGAWRH